MEEKYPITAQSLLLDSYRLAQKILESDFRPDFMISLWRGGVPIGIAVQELLSYSGLHPDHISIRTSAYKDIGVMNGKIMVHGLRYISDYIKPNQRLLLVDDVHDTGKTMQAVIEALKKRLNGQIPKEIRIATVYFKPAQNQTNITPDFYVHKTDKWIIFPHELCGLTEQEIYAYKGRELFEILNKIKSRSETTPV